MSEKKKVATDKYVVAPKMSTFELVTRITAIIIAVALLVVDKGFGLMAHDISEMYYAALAGYGIIGNDIVRRFIK